MSGEEEPGTGSDVGDAEAGGDARGADLVVARQHQHAQAVGLARMIPAPRAALQRRYRRPAARPHLVLECEHPVHTKGFWWYILGFQGFCLKFRVFG